MLAKSEKSSLGNLLWILGNIVRCFFIKENSVAVSKRILIWITAWEYSWMQNQEILQNASLLFIYQFILSDVIRRFTVFSSKYNHIWSFVYIFKIVVNRFYWMTQFSIYMGFENSQQNRAVRHNPPTVSHNSSMNFRNCILSSIFWRSLPILGITIISNLFHWLLFWG